MAKIIALSIADLHFNDWKQFNKNRERTFITSNFLVDLCVKAEEYQVPILVSGDWFHTPKGLSTPTIYLFMELISKIQKNFPTVQFISISGNHEIDQEFSLVRAMEMAFPDTIKCIDDSKIIFPEFTVYGIPYIKRNKGLLEKIETISKNTGNKILLIHTELYGASDPSGYEPEPQNLPRNLNALFKDFKLVLAGHIHKYTPISDNIIMVGAPNQQRKSDAGCKMGYLKIYEDFTHKFVNYKAPGFRYYKEGENHPDTSDFWIEIPIPRKKEKFSDIGFNASMDKTRLAKKYVKAIGVKNLRKIKTLINILNATEE